MLRSSVFLLSFFLMVPSASATVTVDIFQGKAVTEKKGKMSVERIDPVDIVVPGDTVVYRYTVHNNADKPAADVVITATVPDFMTYADGTAAAEGWSIMVSHDNETHAPEGELVIHEIDETSRPAKSSDIRYIRWLLKSTMPADSQKVVEFRATLNK